MVSVEQIVRFDPMLERDAFEAGDGCIQVGDPQFEPGDACAPLDQPADVLGLQGARNTAAIGHQSLQSLERAQRLQIAGFGGRQTGEHDPLHGSGQSEAAPRQGLGEVATISPVFM